MNDKSADRVYYEKKHELLDRFTIQSSTLVLFTFLLLFLFAAVQKNWFSLDALLDSQDWIKKAFLRVSTFPWMPVIILSTPLLGSLIQFFFGEKAGSARDRVVILGTFLTIVLILSIYPMARNGGTLLSFERLLGLGLSFRIDMLAYTFLLLTAIIWFLVMVYAHEYMKRELHSTRFFFFIAITYASVLGAIMAGDLLTMFLFFEVMTVASYMLVIHGQKEDSFRAGFNYIIMGLVGGFMILNAMLLIYVHVGSLSFTSAIHVLKDLGSLKYWIMGLLVLGFGIKAGMAPVHVWLPRAHPVAPTPASALLSGIMIKVGAFGILRVATSYYFPSKDAVTEYMDPIWDTTEAVGASIIWLGIITMAIGVFLALQQANIKRMLAYHSISQMGYIVVGIGVSLYLGYRGAMGYSGALYHTINHALFKSLLFMVAGVVYLHTKQTDMYRLGGLWKKLPLTAAVCLIACLGISGVPLFNGFISKSIIHHGIVEAYEYGHPSFVYAEWIFIVVSAGTVASFIKLFYYVFLRKTKNDYRQIKPTYTGLDTAMAALALLIVVIGIAPRFLLDHFIIPQLDLTTYDPAFIAKYIGDLTFFTTTDLLTMLLVAVLGALIFAVGTKYHLFHLRLPKWLSIEYLFLYPFYRILQKSCTLMYGDKCPIDPVSLQKLSLRDSDDTPFTERFVITMNTFNRRYESTIIQSDALIYTGFITAILLFMFLFGSF
ncbi:MAG: complex I subunit 5 family protein [Acholeplasmataceae bacterium]